MANFHFYAENTKTLERTYLDGGFNFLDDKKVEASRGFFSDFFNPVSYVWLRHLDWLKERHPLKDDEIYIAVDITDMSVYANIPEEDQDWVWVGNMVWEAS